MSRRFSMYTKVIACVLIVAVCAAIVPAALYAEDCEDEKKAAEKATEDAGWACAFSLVGCVYTGGWACALAVAYCLRKTNQASDAWGDYWECKAGAV